MHFYVRSERNGAIEHHAFTANKAYAIVRPRFKEVDGVLSEGLIDIGGTLHQVVSTEHGFKVYKAREMKDPVLKEWGAIVTQGRVSLFTLPSRDRVDVDLCTWLQNKVLGVYVNIGYNNIDDRLDCLNPFRSNKFVGKISVTKSHEDRIRGRETALKVGKALKAIFPELTDIGLGKVVDLYNETFGGKDYKLYDSRDPKVFASVYNEEYHAPMQNPRTTSLRKSIGCSCMRYPFEELPHHPAYVYGSGDFVIYYTKDGQGRTGSRCVVYDTDKTDRPQAGPIYGVCENSMNIIQTELDKMDAECINPDWTGAYLLHIPYGDGDGVVGPYLDLEPRSLSVVDSKHLVVESGGEIYAGDYNGILGDSSHCDDCEEPYCEDSFHYYNDRAYCESCFYERYDYCEWTDEHYPREELVQVLPHEVLVWDQCDNLCQCTDGEWWDIEHAYHVQGENVWISEDTYEKDYFESEWDNEIYHNDDAAHTTEGEVVGIVEVEDAGYEKNDNGQWFDPQSELDLKEGDKK